MSSKTYIPEHYAPLLNLYEEYMPASHPQT